MSAKKLNLLIVEDDPTLASSLKFLVPDVFKVYITQSPENIPDHVFFHAALVDMHLNVQNTEKADGPDVIKKLVKKNPHIEAVAMSGHLDRALMEHALLAGASRFLAKPLSFDEVKAMLAKIEAYWNLRLTQFDINKKSTQLIGKSTSIENLRKKIAQLKSEKSSILIEGETGVGKDIVAQLINKQEGPIPYVAINCSALTENLFESEFFGHVKGAFTGADSNKIGFAESAHGGDLFLDEIEALPLNQQAKLLRFLESGEIRKVGSKDTLHVEVRIIAASNIPLTQLIEEKKFREDLYFRLSTHKIEIPSLKNRKDDIEDLANYFIDMEKPKRNKSFDPLAIEALKHYPWPGNVRELKRLCEQWLLTSPLPIIRKEDLGLMISNTKKESTELLNSSTNLDNPINGPTDFNKSLQEFLNQQEKLYIESCLKYYKEIEKTCEILKTSKSNLYKKIKDLGIKYE